MIFCYRRLLPKNEQNNSIIYSTVRQKPRVQSFSFFGRIIGLKKTLRLFLTFNKFPKNFFAKLWFATVDLKSFEETLSVHIIFAARNKYVLSKISCSRFCHFYHTCIVLLGLIHLSWENGIMTCGSHGIDH